MINFKHIILLYFEMDLISSHEVNFVTYLLISLLHTDARMLAFKLKFKFQLVLIPQDDAHV